MRPHYFLLAVVLAMAAGAASAAPIYIVTLKAAPAAQQLESTERFSPAAKTSLDAVAEIDRQQARALAVLSGGAKAVPTLRHEYRYVAAGFSLALDKAQVQALRAAPDVASVEPDQVRYLQSDAGPAFIGAATAWAQNHPASRGEGRVLGLIDSGINASHPAFADVAGDGYNHTNPRARFYGLCTQGRAVCNDKLIGIYNLTNEGTDGSDLTGHGSHVGSTAVGNPFNLTLTGRTTSSTQLVSGVAPRASLISFKACTRTMDGGPGTCSLADLIAAIDRATLDQVDVINYSIGGDARDPWLGIRSNSNDDHRAMLNARFAGVLSVVAAGNDGPLPGTVTAPANAPWVLSVANSTHNRRFVNRVTDFTGGAIAPPATLVGAGLTGALGLRRIVHGREFGSALCGQGSAQDFPPTGASNPFAPNTFQGQIVICERGIYARVAKGFNVLAAGAGGMILLNTAGDGASINGDDHYLPAVHLPFSEASKLLDWYDRVRAAQGTPQAAISGQTRDLNDAYADQIASSSGRGPNLFPPGVLKPNISAPGTDVLAAIESASNYDFKSGTSMASPHIAGGVLLLKARNPAWGPAQLEGALMGTADPTRMRNSDGVSAAGANDQGAGRVQVDVAMRAGLHFPVTRSAFEQADPLRGGVPEQINAAGVLISRCFGSCSASRSVAPLGAGGSYRVRPNPRVTVTPAEFSLSAAATQVLSITLNVDDPALAGRWVSERVLIDSLDPAQAPTQIRISAFADPGPIPARIVISTSQSSGSQLQPISGLAPVGQAGITTSSFGPATEFTLNAAPDTTPNDAYDGLNVGSDVVREIVTTASAQVPLVIEQIGGSGNTLAYVLEPRGSSSLSPSQERCVLNPSRGVRTCILQNASGVHRLVLQNLGTSASSATFRFFRPSGELNRDLVALIPGRASRNSAFDLRVVWDAPQQLRASAQSFGLIRWNGVPGASEAMGHTIVELNRVEPLRDPPTALRLGNASMIDLGASETREFIVDVPLSNQLILTLRRAQPQDPISIAFVRASEVPSGPQLAFVATPGSFQALTDAPIRFPDALAGQRWHLFVRHAGSAPTRVSVSQVFGDIANNPVIAAGPWFNAARSGAGLNLTSKDGVLVAGWFTYEDDGSNTWYFLNDSIAARAPVWDVAITRTAWDGAQAVGSPVGRAQLTLVGPNDLRFAWQLFGQTGFEKFQPLAVAAACPRVNNVPISYSGSWFRADRPGYGLVFYLTSQAELATLFAYDAAGIPRWAIGTQAAPLLNAPFQMASLRGFCPSCARTEPVSTPAGTLSRSFNSTVAANYSSAVQWPSPLLGAWTDAGVLTIATDVLACPP